MRHMWCLTISGRHRKTNLNAFGGTSAYRLPNNAGRGNKIEAIKRRLAHCAQQWGASQVGPN